MRVVDRGRPGIEPVSLPIVRSSGCETRSGYAQTNADIGRRRGLGIEAIACRTRYIIPGMGDDRQPMPKHQLARIAGFSGRATAFLISCSSAAPESDAVAARPCVIGTSLAVTCLKANGSRSAKMVTEMVAAPRFSARTLRTDAYVVTPANAEPVSDRYGPPPFEQTPN